MYDYILHCISQEAAKQLLPTCVSLETGAWDVQYPYSSILNVHVVVERTQYGPDGTIVGGQTVMAGYWLLIRCTDIDEVLYALDECKAELEVSDSPKQFNQVITRSKLSTDTLAQIKAIEPLLAGTTYLFGEG